MHRKRNAQPRERTELEHLCTVAALWQSERHPRIFGDIEHVPVVLVVETAGQLEVVA
jgi:hypothetical protein